MPESRLPRPSLKCAGPILLVAAQFLLVACSTLEHQPEPAEDAPERASIQTPPYYLRAELDDPFTIIDRAVRQVGLMKPPPELDDDSETDLWQRIVERFSFTECPESSRAKEWAEWFGAREEYMERVMARARPWLYHIAEEIEARDMPGEMALLPIVESAYDPFAYSHGRAAGSWQFLKATARDNGLEINDFYDGRRDVYASSRAALDYLDYLHERFGDWNLALAAYNGGQGRVQRALNRANSRGQSSHWQDLRLPGETLAYVPKLNGLGCLFAEPARYGYQLPEWPNEPVVAPIRLDGPTDIVVLSVRTGIELAELVALNPGLNGHLTSPTGPHVLVVPVEYREAVESALPTLNGAEQVAWQEITVRRGDTLSGLAQRHSVSISSLREANNLNGDLVRAGQTLRLAERGAVPEDSPYAERYQELASLHERLLPTRRFQHQVRPGESLWIIARRYQVSVSDLRGWNGLGGSNMIRPGQRLVIHMDPPRPSARSKRYTVQRGDSLWLIARRHEVSVADLLRWNEMPRDAVLQPGQKLTIRSASDA